MPDKHYFTTSATGGMAPSSGYRRPIALLRTGTLTSRMQHNLHIFLRGYEFQGTFCPIHDALHCSFYIWHHSKSLFQPFVISCTKGLGSCHLPRPGFSPLWRASWMSQSYSTRPVDGNRGSLPTTSRQLKSATVVLAVLYITNLAIRNHTYVPSSYAASDWLTQLWPVWTRGYPSTWTAHL
ncbi:uncharacterized protein B0T23DRAFT_404065 [Neurospora hispaniola]|uniref:Uncharacterized protein n=1 Tax=Neurospora hispaniola TaxID=588809 RepID=A0AAJ0IB41_9PEZI|nr:hypothetical protein B0T23DRAFT_404065 [Neurospora hispaniola]